jgi:hypothetical protein
VESGWKDKYGLLVLGAKGPDGEIVFNPPANHVLNTGQTRIVMGDMDDIARAKKEF